MIKPDQTIEVPQFITHVKLSNKRRAKYFMKGSEVPKRYMNYRYNKKNQLVDPFNEPVVKNIRSVGTPNFKKINGQEFYKGVGNPIIRAKMIKEMKTFFRKFIKTASPLGLNDYPVKVSIDLYLPLGKMDFDIDNLSWVYIKAISDVLVDCGIVFNDTVEYIINTGECRYFPVDEIEQRKMIINIYKNWAN